MEEAAVSALSRWENFYVIVGSSAGALTGLQFVVIALIAETEALGGVQEIRAFGTPTIVHFCVSLLIAAIVISVILWLKPKVYDASDVEVAGLYWHFVDLVWMFIFPLVYLMSTRII